MSEGLIINLAAMGVILLMMIGFLIVCCVKVMHDPERTKSDKSEINHLTIPDMVKQLNSNPVNQISKATVMDNYASLVFHQTNEGMVSQNVASENKNASVRVTPSPLEHEVDKSQQSTAEASKRKPEPKIQFDPMRCQVVILFPIGSQGAQYQLTGQGNTMVGQIPPNHQVTINLSFATAGIYRVLWIDRQGNESRYGHFTIPERV